MSTALLDSLLALSRVLEADQQRELERRGLTPARTHLLWVLHHGGPATQAHLAEQIGVTPRNVTTLVDALESTGFARRAAHPTDRRAVLVRLTEQGRDAMAAMAAEHERFAADLVAGLDPETIEAAQTAVAHVLARLEHLIAEHESALDQRSGSGT